MCRHLAELEVTHVRVLLVCFGTPDQARAWLLETESPFPLLLDPQRNTYRAFSLERSFSKSWNPRTILLYARLLLSGRRWRGIRGDSAQLGGDVIVDGRGIVRLVYRSRDPADRPEVSALLKVLRNLADELRGGPTS